MDEEMTTLNATEKKAINYMVETGFTFYGDAIFTTFIQAKRCLDGLVRKGYATKSENMFVGTEFSTDFVKYGIIN